MQWKYLAGVYVPYYWCCLTVCLNLFLIDWIEFFMQKTAVSNTRFYGPQLTAKLSVKMRAFWDIAPCSLVGVHRFIALMMEAVRTSDTTGYSNETTRRYVPRGYHFHTRCRENLKSHIAITNDATQLHRHHSYNLKSNFLSLLHSHYYCYYCYSCYYSIYFMCVKY
jgi:hypothetical protein